MTDFLTCQLCNGSKRLLDDPCPCDSVAYLNSINNKKSEMKNDSSSSSSHAPSITPAEFAERFDAAMGELDNLNVATVIMAGLHNLAYDALAFTASHDAGTLMLGVDGCPRLPSREELDDLEPKSPVRARINSGEFLMGDKTFDVLFDEESDGGVNLIATMLGEQTVYGVAFVQAMEDEDENKDGDNE